MKKLLIPLLLAVMLCFGIAAAEQDGLRFEESGAAVAEAETLQAVLIREGACAEGKVVYSSANAKVAAVDENGVITGVSKGQTTVTAAVEAGGKTFRAQLKVTVRRRVTALELSASGLQLYAPGDPALSVFPVEGGEEPVLVIPVKKALTLRVNVLPKDATDRRVVLSSADESILRVKGAAVTGAAAGETVLTVASQSDPEVALKYRVLVIQSVKKLTVTATAPSLAVGGQVTVSAAAEPEDATVKQVVWSSGTEKILSVDENGTVTGLSRGSGRIIAMAADGSKARANFSLKVIRMPESLELSQQEITVDTGRSVPVKATVLPKDADNKKVSWTSSDEGVATVNKSGRITGVRPGDCVVTCVSEASGEVSASVTVHVQQPVKKVSFLEKSGFAYAGETTQLAWKVEPADATNPRVAFTSSDERVLTVDENGLVTGVGHGKAYVNMVTTDGSNRKARIQITVGLHVQGVHMVRSHAYIDRGETATAGAELEPKNAANNHMTWVSSDESVVTAKGNTNAKMRLKGVGYGEATVTGTTEDGGYETSIRVTVGNFDHGLSFREFDYDSKGNFWLRVRNDSGLTVTKITATVEMYDTLEGNNDPLNINRKNGSNKVDVVWSGSLAPGETTGRGNWKMVNYQPPKNGPDATRGFVTVVSYQIDNDWIKTIRQSNRPWKEY